MFSGLELTLFLLAAAVLGVVAFRMMQLPPMLGYLVVGIIIGPHGLAFAEDNETTHALAEFGVVFLMFSIGLEFSLSKLSLIISNVTIYCTYCLIVTIVQSNKYFASVRMRGGRYVQNCTNIIKDRKEGRGCLCEREAIRPIFFSENASVANTRLCLEFRSGIGYALANIDSARACHASNE